MAVIEVDELTVNVAAAEPSLTEVAPVKFVPVIVTFVPVKPCVGVKPVIVGLRTATVVTVKFVELVPVPFGGRDGDLARRRAARDVGVDARVRVDGEVHRRACR